MLLASAGSIALAIAMTWPTLRHPASTVPGDLGDPLLQAWQLAWGGEALREQPTALFDANTFWPLRHSLAFSDSLLGYAPAGLLSSGPSAALVRYNLLYVGAFALAFLGAYLLARQLGVRAPAAAIAGAAFAYAPWRIAHAGHLNILSTGGIALSLALLLRGSTRSRPGLVLAGWAVVAWQLSLGFGLGLPFGYGLAVIALAVGLRWVAAGRPRLPRSLVAAHLGGGVLAAGVALALAAPYFAVAEAHPEARRTAADVALFAPPPRGYLIAPAEAWLWGPLQADPRAGLGWPPEMTVAVGATVVTLGVAGLALAGWSWRRRLLLVGTAVVAAVVGAGTTVLGGRYTYLPLLEHAPGWAGLRSPGRLVVYVSLALGLLAAAGADALARRGRWLRWVPAAGLGLVLLEGVSTVEHPRPDPPPAAFVGAAAPLLVLPSADVVDAAPMLWSTAGFPALVNGSSGFVPREIAELRATVAAFPAPAAVQALRARGVRSVVVRPGNPAPSPPPGVRRTAYADGSARYLLGP